MLLLQELACGSCLRVESEANEASSAAPPVDRAPEGARSAAQGHGLGVAFLLPTFLRPALRWRSKEQVGALPGATPGLRPQEKSRRQFASAASKSTAACPHPNPLPQAGEGVKPARSLGFWGSSRQARLHQALPRAGKGVKQSPLAFTQTSHRLHTAPKPCAIFLASSRRLHSSFEADLHSSGHRSSLLKGRPHAHCRTHC